jgi:uncharacterized protein (UPF0335 family)
MDLLDCCLNNSYFQEKDTFYSQIDGLPMGSSLSPVIANIYMEWFESQAIDKALIKPKLWLRYLDDTFIISNGNDNDLQAFLDHMNNLAPTIKFTMEKEENNKLPFLDVMIQKHRDTIQTSVYRKPTHTGQYLNFTSNHSSNTKHGIIKTLVDRAFTICNSQETVTQELINIKKDLSTNGYPIKLIDQTINKRQNQTNRQKEHVETTGPTINIPYVKGVSEKIR